MALAGFSVANQTESARLYKKLKKKSLPKKAVPKEIKSTNTFSDLYILPKLLSVEYSIPNIKIGIVLQEKRELGQDYYFKGKLNYDKLYLNLVRTLLLNTWKYVDREVVIVTLDTFTTKRISKQNISETIKTELKLKNPNVNFDVRFGTSEIENLQLADQICGIVHKKVFGRDDYFNKMKKVYPVKFEKNPL
jgi:hypothetical protein